MDDLDSALEHLKKAQVHLIQIAALADDQSKFINDHLPPLVMTLEMLIKNTADFYDRL